MKYQVYWNIFSFMLNLALLLVITTPSIVEFLKPAKISFNFTIKMLVSFPQLLKDLSYKTENSVERKPLSRTCIRVNKWHNLLDMILKHKIPGMASHRDVPLTERVRGTTPIRQESGMLIWNLSAKEVRLYINNLQGKLELSARCCAYYKCRQMLL